MASKLWVWSITSVFQRKFTLCSASPPSSLLTLFLVLSGKLSSSSIKISFQISQETVTGLLQPQSSWIPSCSTSGSITNHMVPSYSRPPPRITSITNCLHVLVAISPNSRKINDSFILPNISFHFLCENCFYNLLLHLLFWCTILWYCCSLLFFISKCAAKLDMNAHKYTQMLTGVWGRIMGIETK